MPSIDLNTLSMFSPWFQQVLIISLGAVVLATCIARLIKVCQSPSVVSFLAAIFRTVSKLGAFLQRQIDDPFKYPKVERFLQYATIIHSYAMSALLLFYFTTLVILAGLYLNPSSVNYWAVIAFSFLCVYMAAVLKAQAGRERVKLRASRVT